MMLFQDIKKGDRVSRVGRVKWLISPCKDEMGEVGSGDLVQPQSDATICMLSVVVNPALEIMLISKMPSIGLYCKCLHTILYSIMEWTIPEELLSDPKFASLPL
jgi:hypothetical protein